MTEQDTHVRERTLKLNPWASIAICCVMLVGAPLVGFLVHANLKHQQARELASHIRAGCANPENHYATVIIELPYGSWSCTPMDLPEHISRKHRKAMKRGG